PARMHGNRQGRNPGGATCLRRDSRCDAGRRGGAGAGGGGGGGRGGWRGGGGRRGGSGAGQGGVAGQVGGGFGAAGDLELGQDGRDVVLDRLLGQAELGADLAVGPALGDQPGGPPPPGRE